MSEEQKKLLEQQLWNIANILRGKISANQFQDYILGFIFYKYLSEKMEKYANTVLKPDNLNYNELEEASKLGQQYLAAIEEASVEAIGFFLKPSELFSSLAQKGNAKIEDEENEEQAQSVFILEDLANILRSIEKSTMGTESEDDFDGLFYDLDLNSTKLGRTVKDRNAVIVKIIGSLNEIDFDLDNTEGDILGDAYEYLIAQFAAGAGQKAGEFYTPQQVSTILSKIVTTRKSKLKSVYDPTCGSGSLLLRVAKEVDEVSHFYGQEQNRTTYNLARMNMILHNVSYHKFDIKHEDTLERPQHTHLKFEAIVANPPFSVSWSANPLFSGDDRFSQYGKLAPKTIADFAFIQHMIYQLDDNGIMACIAPHGILYRGGAEGHIRKYLIEDGNYIDAIIGLPSNIFYGASIPTCILVLKKCRENSEDILFIDAREGFDKLNGQNYLRDEDVDKIVSTYQSRQKIDKYSNTATIEDVKNNKYSLNIINYLKSFEVKKQININDLCANLKTIDDKLIIINNSLNVFCESLNIPFPSGNNLSLLKEYKVAVRQMIIDGKIKFLNEKKENYEEWDYVILDDVLDYIQPTKYIVKSTDYDNSFDTPVLTAGKTFILGYTNEVKGIFNENLPVIIFDDFTTANKFVDFNFKVKSSAMKILVKKNEDINLKYVYEVIQTIKFPTGDAHKRYWISEYSNCIIPLPCIDEQNIIEKFLSLIDDKINVINENFIR